MQEFKKLGFIGLGIMGKPMAKNLIKAGYQLIVHDIVDSAVEEMVSFGAEAALSPQEVAVKSDNIVITMLPNSPHVKEVVCGEKGILRGARTGTIIVDMSSISPVAAIDIADKAKEKGVFYLDCPVSGGEPKAVDGTLAIMAGGNQEAFEKVKDILLKMGSSAIRIGDVGSGSVAKLANQIIVAMNIAALGEAFTLASKLNVDAEKVYEAIKGGLAGSTVMNAKMPMILEGNFKPGFRIELHIKDLRNAVEAAQSGEVNIPLTKEILAFMEQLYQDGKGQIDHGGLVHYYEKISNIEIRRKK